jgi:hypothetical protein
MNFQVVLGQATLAGTSKADGRARTTADTAAAEDPVPGRAGPAASEGTEADEIGRPGGKRRV